MADRQSTSDYVNTVVDAPLRFQAPIYSRGTAPTYKDNNRLAAHQADRRIVKTEDGRPGGGYNTDSEKMGCFVKASVVGNFVTKVALVQGLLKNPASDKLAISPYAIGEAGQAISGLIGTSAGKLWQAAKGVGRGAKRLVMEPEAAPPAGLTTTQKGLIRAGATAGGMQELGRYGQQQQALDPRMHQVATGLAEARLKEQFPASVKPTHLQEKPAPAVTEAPAAAAAETPAAAAVTTETPATKETTPAGGAAPAWMNHPLVAQLGTQLSGLLHRVATPGGIGGLRGVLAMAAPALIANMFAGRQSAPTTRYQPSYSGG